MLFLRRKKLISLLMSAFMVFPNLAFADEESAAIDPSKITSPTMPDASKVVPTEVKDQYENAKANALLSALGELSGTGAGSFENENKVLVANATKKAAQQENTSTSEEIQSTMITLKNGDTVYVNWNPCYKQTTPTKLCQNPEAMLCTNQTSNSDGTTTNTNCQMSRYVEYVRSDGGPITSEIQSKMALMSAAKQNGDGSGLMGVMTDLTMTMADNANLSNEQQKNAVMASLLNSSQINKQNNLISYNQALQKSGEDKKNEDKAKEDKKAEDIQKTRNILSPISGDAPYTVKLTPTIPTIGDMEDVYVTLIPKNKNGGDSVKTPSQNGEKTDKGYKIKMRFLDLDTNKFVELDSEKGTCAENVPLKVEHGSAKKRTVGTRDIEVTYTYDNGTVKRSRFSYSVITSETFLTEDGNMLLNSVRGAIANADIFATNGQSFPLAGKVNGAFWDSGKQTCVLNVSDENLHENGQASVSTTNMTEEHCKSAVGTYVSMAKVNAEINENGEIEFKDTGSSAMKESVFEQTAAQYAAIQEASNRAAVQGGVDSGIRYSDNVHGYVRGGYGEINKDYALMQDGTIVAVDWNESRGSWEIANVTPQKILQFYTATGIDPSSLKFGTDPDKCTISDTDGKLLTKDNFDNSDVLDGKGSLAAYKRNETLVKGAGKGGTTIVKTGSGKSILDATIETAVGIGKEGVGLMSGGPI